MSGDSTSESLQGGLLRRGALAARQHLYGWFAVVEIAWRWRARGKLAAKSAGGPPLVVSMTSHRARFPTLHLSLKCILAQSIAADRNILWVAAEDRPHLPPAVLELAGSGLEIRATQDLGPYTKLVPSLRAFPDAAIVTADDDTWYARDWLERLVARQNAVPAVICHRAYRMPLDHETRVKRYVDWGGKIKTAEEGFEIFATGVGGILYPPGLLGTDGELLCEIMKCCPLADDVGLFWFTRLRGIPARTTGHYRTIINWPGSQAAGLLHGNTGPAARNDAYIGRLTETYGIPQRLRAASRG